MNVEFSQSAIPLDESSISKTFEKESKKLLRMPFYKREELKKQEERKQKNKNHYHQHKKKEEIPKIEKKDNKYKKIIKKKDEPTKIPEANHQVNLNTNPPNKQTITNTINNVDHKPQPNVNETLNLKVSNKKNDLISFNTILNKIEETENEYDREKISIKREKKPTLTYSDLNVNEGDYMKKKKYENREVRTQKFRLSKKQRRLQEGENTLGSFLTKEEKNSLFQIKEKVKKNKKITKTEDKKQNNQNISEKIDQKPTNTNNNNDIVVKGKRKKRVNKYKKAIYKYRYQKKKFILENVLKFNESKQNQSENEINVNATQPNKIVENNKPSEEQIKQSINLNPEVNINIKSHTQNINEFNNHKNIEINTKFNSKDNNFQINTFNKQTPSSYNNFNMYMPSYSNYLNSIYYPYQTNNYYPLPTNVNYYTNVIRPQMNYYNYQHMPYDNYYFPSNNTNMIDNTQYAPFLNNNPLMYNKSNNFNKEPSYYQNIKSFNTKNINTIPPQFPNMSTENNFYQKSQKTKKKKKPFKPNKEDLINPSPFEISLKDNDNNKPFLFEQKMNEDLTEKELKQIDKQELIQKIKESYQLDVDLDKLQGEEFNKYLKEHKDLKRISLKQLEKLSNNKSLMNEYIKNFEGLQPGTNYNKKIIREYVDQILSLEFDKTFSEFVEKIREMYFKKKQTNPMKAKKRFVVGMREVEKYIRLDETKCIFIVPNIEKVEGKNSLDERLLNIIQACRKKNIPIFYGLNKFKLGKLCRKKFSSVSILSIINVESLDREFKNLVELGDTFRKKFYEKNESQKEIFKENIFIDVEMFDSYKNKTI